MSSELERLRAEADAAQRRRLNTEDQARADRERRIRSLAEQHVPAWTRFLREMVAADLPRLNLEWTWRNQLFGRKVSWFVSSPSNTSLQPHLDDTMTEAVLRELDVWGYDPVPKEIYSAHISELLGPPFHISLYPGGMIKVSTQPG